MADTLPRVGAIGYRIKCTLTDPDTGSAIDISGSTLSMVLIQPDGTRLVKTPLLTTDGTDGKLYYSTVSGDFNRAGVYQLEVNVTTGGNYIPSDVRQFRVGAAI